MPLCLFLVNIDKFNVKIGINRHANKSWCIGIRTKLKSYLWDDLLTVKAGQAKFHVAWTRRLEGDAGSLKIFVSLQWSLTRVSDETNWIETWFVNFLNKFVIPDVPLVSDDDRPLKAHKYLETSQHPPPVTLIAL